MAGKKDLERLRRRKRRKQRIIRATVHFFVWAGVAVLYYIGFSIFFDTPVRVRAQTLDRPPAPRIRRPRPAVRLAHDRPATTSPSATATSSASSSNRIPTTSIRSTNSRQAVTYENIFNRSSRRLKLELRERVADMEKRLDELNASYLDLQALIDSAGSGCNNIPARSSP